MGIEGLERSVRPALQSIEGQSSIAERVVSGEEIRRIAERMRRIGNSLPESTSPEHQKRIMEKVGEIGLLLSSYAYRLSAILVGFKGVGVAALGGFALQVSDVVATGGFLTLGTLILAIAARMYEVGEQKEEEYRKRAAQV